jgi:threonine/homoserine/homoserine lactone efflux protein
LIAATGLAHGVRRGYRSIAGLEIGLMAQLAVVALGLGAVLAASSTAFMVVKWIGFGYLVYLAVRQWRTAGVWLTQQMSRPQGGRMSLLLRGFLVMRLLRTARRQAALSRVFSGLFATAALAPSLMRRTASV